MDWFSLDGSVQINQVQPMATLFLPRQGHGQRVIGEHRLLIEVALKETDTTAVFQVYGGDYFHISSRDWACG